MSNAKHTEGPWGILGPLGTGHDTKYLIGHESPGRSGGKFCEVSTLHKTPEALATAEANARLIKTAPDLLATLRIFANIAEHTALREAMIEAARPHEQADVRKAFDDAKALVREATGKS